MSLCWAELVIFLSVAALSGFLFWRRTGVVLGIVRRSKPDPDFKLRPVRRRLRRLFWEVLLQAKVIRERPLPGLAHAFVFWGFCAFALVTFNHLGRAIGLAFLSRAGGFGRFYFWLAAVFAVAVAVSIAGLAIRRFLVRPKWLGALSPGSGLIWLPEETAAGRLNW